MNSKTFNTEGPFRINLETNPGTCNLSCIICDTFSIYNKNRASTDRESRRYLDPGIFKSVFYELKEKRLQEVVTTSMGEPFMYPCLEDLVQACKEYDLQLHLTTNGTFPNGGVLKWAESLNEIGADIKVSINGASDETQKTIMPGADPGEVLSNIRTYVKIRDKIIKRKGKYSRLTLKITFMQNNINELPDLIRIAHATGFDRIRGSHLKSLYPETDHLELLRDRESKILFNTVIIRSREVAEELKRKTGRAIELSQFQEIDSNRIYGDCPYLGEEIWLDPEGNMLPCCVPSEYKPDIKFGNVSASGILTLWNSDKYTDFCENYLNYKECKTCEKRIIYH